MSYSVVRAVTSPELAYLRSEGQWSQLYLAIFQPSVVYTARLAAVPSTTDRVVEITFNTGSGTLADVLPDMTLWVGSTAGTYDLGVARIRKAPIAGTFYIGEESDIDWQATCYLTVTNEFDLWPKHINTVDDDTFYMDHDIVYTDQNTVFSPVPIMGGHRVLKLSGSSISTQFDWSNSYCIDSSIASYSVSCPTASGITGGTTSTPTIQFDAAGWHVVILTVTATNGKISVGIRYVYVYSDSVPPITVFQLNDCSEDYEQGGWNFTVTMQDEIDLASIPERSMCILFAEDYYGGEKVSLGQHSGCENIVCMGRIAEEMVDLNSEQSEVTLSIKGMQFWFSQVFAFPTGAILSTNTPSNWAEMQSPTVQKILFRLLHWGCTATKIMDCYLTSDTRIASELTSPASNLWGQINEIAFTSIYARPGVDRFGRLFIEIEPQVVPLASRTWPSIITITEEDWFDSITIQRVVVSPTSMVNLSGVYVISSGDGGAIFSLAPGHVFKRYGAPDVVDRMLLASQAASNVSAGLALEWANLPYPNNEMNLSANNRMIDCFPRQKVSWSIAEGDTPRGFGIDADFIPRRVELKWDETSGFLSTELTLEMETTSEGVYTDGDVPGSGEYDPADPPTPPAFPPLPDYPPLFPVDVTPGIAVKILFYDPNGGLIYTENIGDDSPTYIQVNSGLGTGVWDSTPLYNLVHRVFVTPSGAIYVVRLRSANGFYYANPNGDHYFFIYRSPGVGHPFVKLRDPTDIPTPGFFGDNAILTFGVNMTLPDTVGWVELWDTAGPTTKFFTSTGGATPVEGYNGLPGTGGGDQSGEGLSFGNGEWLYHNGLAYYRLNAAGSSLIASATLGTLALDTFNRHNYEITRASTSGRVFCDGDSGGLVFSENNLVSNSLLTANVQGGLGLACDPTGNYLMGRYTSTANKGKSSDAGASWSALASLPAGNWYFGYAGWNADNSLPMWIAANAVIRFTDDHGSTWTEKTTTSLTDIVPFPNIQHIKVIP